MVRPDQAEEHWGLKNLAMDGTAAALTSTSKPGSDGAFRIDINALRALSVVAVVGYHFRIFGFAGGFVGVDIFLVITGYLMTGKVLTDLALDRFSFVVFGAMRLRRIYPALAVMTVSSVVAGWFLTLPGEYLKHLLQALSALTFVSNFAFDSDNGYFAMAAQTKPLLHTWSLSVEWQFYIWMPLIAKLIWRLASGSKSRPGALLLAFQVVAVLSLIWCLWKSQNDAMGASYFSLRARAWEPLAGGLIAAFEGLATIQRRSERALDGKSGSSHRRLGIGCGLCRLSHSRIAMARRAHHPSDLGRGNGCGSATGDWQHELAQVLSYPAVG
jgi:peptidoglycan/LPS O-acetylase OafA/YrhL